MKKQGIGLIVGLLLAPLCMAIHSPAIRQLVERGGSGEYHCAFQKKPASKLCQVKVADEFSKHPGVMAFMGAKKPVKISVISIVWPDQSKSRYWFSDSLTMFNLDDEAGWGYDIRQAPGDGMEIDWRRGFVIEKQQQEYIRLW